MCFLGEIKKSIFFFFFFSSRRRHTRSLCDWSSDVCSSDLPVPEPEGVRVWVVRPRSHNELGACLAAGVVGLGTQSGIDVDATGLTPGELRALSKEISGR